MKEDVARKAGRGHTSNAGQGSGRAPFPEPENQRPAVLQPGPTQPRALGPGASRARGLEGACCLSVALGPLRTSRQPLAEDRVWRGPASSTPSGEAEARDGCAAPPAPAHGSPAPTLFDWTGCGADWLTPVFSGRGEGWTSSAMSGAVGDPTGPEGCEPPPSVSPRGCLLLRSRGRRAAGRAVGVSWSAALQGGPALRARTRRAAGGVKGPAPRRRWPLRLVEQRQAPLPGQAPPPRPRKAARGGCRAHLSGHLPH